MNPLFFFLYSLFTGLFITAEKGLKKGSIINVGVRKYSFLTPFLHKKVDIDGIHSYN